LKKARIIVVALSATAIVALAITAVAGAALPKPKTTLIVPGKSLAGVPLGATAAKVQKEWGHSKECEFQCTYEGGKNGDETAAHADVLLQQPASGKGPAKAWQILISVGAKTVGDESKPDFNTPLTAYKTSKGIGLGSTIGEVQRAYPSAKKTTSPSVTIFEVKGKKEINTIFDCVGATKVTAIAVESHRGG
jgi:hypothetical protein